jgi:hypothetical protein
LQPGVVGVHLEERSVLLRRCWHRHLPARHTSRRFELRPDLIRSRRDAQYFGGKRCREHEARLSKPDDQSKRRLDHGLAAQRKRIVTRVLFSAPDDT